jgi:hypothetical protein
MLLRVESLNEGTVRLGLPPFNASSLLQETGTQAYV